MLSLLEKPIFRKQICQTIIVWPQIVFAPSIVRIRLSARTTSAAAVSRYHSRTSYHFRGSSCWTCLPRNPTKQVEAPVFALRLVAPSSPAPPPSPRQDLAFPADIRDLLPLPELKRSFPAVSSGHPVFAQGKTLRPRVAPTSTSWSCQGGLVLYVILSVLL